MRNQFTNIGGTYVSSWNNNNLNDNGFDLSQNYGLRLGLSGGHVATVTPQHISLFRNGEGYVFDVDGWNKRLYMGGNPILAVQQAAVSDASDADDAVRAVNELLARVRAHGLIAT
jgi:hypothetical protein